MSDVQILMIQEEDNTVTQPKPLKFERALWIAGKSSTACVLILQIITLALFAYTVYELSIVKAQVQPTLNYLTKSVNITKLGNALETGEFLIDTVKNDLLPDYYSVRPFLKQLPYFINETETFIKQIRAAFGKFLQPPTTPTTLFTERCVCT